MVLGTTELHTIQYRTAATDERGVFFDYSINAVDYYLKDDSLKFI
jgi:hypothetical protein